MINKKLLNPIQNKGATKTGTSAEAHDTLTNRDKAEQHPISAISGLQDTLDNFVTLDTDQTITGRKTFSKLIPIEYNDKKFYIETTASGILRLTSPTEIHFENNAGILFVLTQNGISCFNKRLTAIGDPTNEKDATTKKYVDDGLTLKANQTDVVDLSSTQAVRGNKTFMNACYVNTTPTNGKGITNKEYVDTNLALKADKTDLTDAALTSKTNTFEFRQVIKSGGSGLLDLQTATGSVLNTTYDLASTSVKLTSPNTTSMTFTAKDFNFNSKELKNIATPTANKSAANKEYVDTELALKADKLVVPINASIDTSTTINDRVVKVGYKEYTSTGDSGVASTSAGFGYLNASIIRKKSDNSW